MRRAWEKRVSAEVGPLLDAWEQLPNDLKQQIEEEAPELANAIEALESAALEPAVPGEERGV